MTSQEHEVIIIGAGLSGLSAARFLKDKQADIDLLILEESNRAGGVISSHNDMGYLSEWGPHGFLDNCQQSRTLIELAGLGGEVEKAPLKKFSRYICLGGKLNTIPQTPLKILKAPILSVAAKLKICADLFKKPMSGEPSVHDWVKYRFGKELVPFADAVFTGTYAGDINKLSIDAVMPGVRNLEKKHGSVTMGVIKKVLANKKEKENKGQTGKFTFPAMTSFRTGMGRLPQALAASLDASGEISYQTTVKKIIRNKEGWQVITSRNTFSCRHLIMALPVNGCLPLLAGLNELNPPPLTSVPEAGILTVALGFSRQAEIPFGFGYLAPESEQRFTLGTLFSSHMFPGRAPAGQQLIEALIGGRRHPERIEMDDEEIIANVCNDLGQLMELPAPSYARVLRPGGTIPQLERGYPALLDWYEKLHKQLDDLHVCGFGWKGIGINDMTKEAWRIAERILSQQAENEEAEVKGVYF